MSARSAHVRAVPRREARPLSHWIARPLFGVLLAALALEADFGGAEYLALLIGGGAMLAAREWHRMVASGSRMPETLLSGGFILSALAAVTLWPSTWYAWAMLAAGALAVAAFAALRGHSAFWQGLGVLYIGVPAAALVLSRAVPANGALVIVGLFLAVWATDTGALFAGRLVGGPKLAPVLSPNKTWAGTLGGMAAAAVVEAVYVGALGGVWWKAALYGAGLSIAAHLGDLFESFVKRRFHRKDSGSIIPGHGGVLDRIDSLLAAGLGTAMLIFVFRLDLLFGAQP